jgi:cytochrome c oxidase cbb3-type subunit 1
LSEIKVQPSALRQTAASLKSSRIPMTQAAAHGDDAPFDAIALYTFTGVAALVAILATALSPDPSFRFHGWIMMGAFLSAFAMMSIGLGSGRFRSDPTRYADGVIRAG